jgi:hypothetical protein
MTRKVLVTGISFDQALRRAVSEDAELARP